VHKQNTHIRADGTLRTMVPACNVFGLWSAERKKRAEEALQDAASTSEGTPALE
jgi:hypothetical protein